MPAGSRAGSRLRSGSLPRPSRLTLKALRPAYAPRTPDSNGDLDTGSELGPGSPAPTAEVSGRRG
uniref:Sterile alpha motif domain containing 8 n=1 Tax=Mus musculus TaxID=10090 RepID=D6REI9_MOUSE